VYFGSFSPFLGNFGKNGKGVPFTTGNLQKFKWAFSVERKAPFSHEWENTFEISFQFTERVWN